MKTALVTGGAGFIGTNLILKLLEENYNILSLDNYSTGLKSNEIPGVKYIVSDIHDIIDIKENIDICFHLAAQSRVQPSFENPYQSINTNVIGTTKVMEWAKNKKVKIVYAGSSSKHHNPADSPYAMSKYLGEEICNLYKKSFKINVEIARFYNVYGPYEPLDEKNGNVIGIWQVKVSKNKPLEIVGDGNQKRDFTHVIDIVDGLIKIAESDIKHNDAWEIGTGVNYSINELYNMFNKRFNVNAIYVKDQPGNYRETLRTNDDLINLLNWHPEDRLKEYINNLK